MDLKIAGTLAAAGIVGIAAFATFDSVIDSGGYTARGTAVLGGIFGVINGFQAATQWLSKTPDPFFRGVLTIGAAAAVGMALAGVANLNND